MSQQHEIELEQRAQEMLLDPYFLPAILDEIARRPGWLPVLSMILSDARAVYRNLDSIMQAAAAEAAKEEIQRGKWLDEQDARFDQELEEAFASKTEWNRAQEAA